MYIHACILFIYCTGEPVFISIMEVGCFFTMNYLLLKFLTNFSCVFLPKQNTTKLNIFKYKLIIIGNMLIYFIEIMISITLI